MKIQLIDTGYFYVDCGVMFGAIPKTAWQHRYPCNDKNQGVLAMRSALVHSEDGRIVLIDTGAGDKQLKQLSYYGFFNLTCLTEELARREVLKGPNASALYGSRAQNGVIVVTTKSAGYEQPLRITYNGNFSWSQLYDGYDFQWLYGQGNNGNFDIEAKEGWGPLMTGQKIQNWREWFYNENAEEYAMTAQKNRIKDFFRTGFNTSNSIAMLRGPTSPAEWG